MNHVCFRVRVFIGFLCSLFFSLWDLTHRHLCFVCLQSRCTMRCWAQKTSSAVRGPTLPGSPRATRSRSSLPAIRRRAALAFWRHTNSSLLGEIFVLGWTLFCTCVLYTLLSQWEFLPWEILVAFHQGKPAATESRYSTLINYKVHAAGSFRVSIIHRTLTWTAGVFNVRTWPFLCVRAWVFPSQKCCVDWLSVCPTPVCIRMHKTAHVRTLKIL